jgi:drug/metabolite transporter (DMT)-like permease
MSLLVKLAGGTLPTMEIVLARSMVMAGLSAGAIVATGGDFRGREPRLLLLRGVLGFVALTCFFYAVIHLPLAEATVIHFTSPVFTALIAAVALGESLRGREMLLAALSLCGVALVARPAFLFGGSASSLEATTVLIALGGAMVSAGAYTTVRRLRNERAMVIVFYFATVSGLGAIPAVIPVWTTPTPMELLLLLGVGVATHLGQLCLIRGLRSERAGRAMTVGYIQIVFAALWGALVFGDVPDGWSVVGALVIIASTFFVSRN